jgi:hypothetical protein
MTIEEICTKYIQILGTSAQPALKMSGYELTFDCMIALSKEHDKMIDTTDEKLMFKYKDIDWRDEQWEDLTDKLSSREDDGVWLNHGPLTPLGEPTHWMPLPEPPKDDK